MGRAMARSYALRQRMLHFVQNLIYYITVEVRSPPVQHAGLRDRLLCLFVGWLLVCLFVCLCLCVCVGLCVCVCVFVCLFVLGVRMVRRVFPSLW